MLYIFNKKKTIIFPKKSLMAEIVIKFNLFCEIYCQPLERENKAKLKFMMNTVNLVRHPYN